MERAATPDHQTNSLKDAVVAFWVVLWLTVGILTGSQVWSLASVSEAVDASATATDKAGQALQQVSEIPLVPDAPGELGDEVRAAAEEIALSADRIDSDVRRLAVLVGVSLALVPTTPVIFWYLPWRLRWRRTVESIRQEIERGGRTPELDAYLAHRAVAEVGYRELTAVTRDPVGDLLAGRHSTLADEELRRLGLPVGTTGRDGP